jgi:hypothetical protein
LTGSTTAWINALPWVLVVAAVAGVLVVVVRQPAGWTEFDSALEPAAEPG